MVGSLSIVCSPFVVRGPCPIDWGDWIPRYGMVTQPEVASTGLPPACAERFRGHSLVEKEKGMRR